MFNKDGFRHIPMPSNDRYEGSLLQREILARSKPTTHSGHPSQMSPKFGSGKNVIHNESYTPMRNQMSAPPKSLLYSNSIVYIESEREKRAFTLCLNFCRQYNLWTLDAIVHQLETVYSECGVTKEIIADALRAYVLEK